MGKRILMIEDNEDNRRILRDLLTSKGYDVIEAEDGIDGVSAAETFRPDLILMDIQLPGIDGVEALRRLRADPATQGIPVIAVTASVMNAQQAEFRDAGFDDLEFKPVSVAGLLRKVRVLLDESVASGGSR